MIHPAADKDPIVWLNGAYMPLSRAGISPMDRGFLYGDGVFETMRAESGRILDLGKHLERLDSSLAELRIALEGAVNWESTLDGLLIRNGLDRTTASVKIVVTRGISSGFGLPRPLRPTLFAMSQTYEPPTEAAYGAGWNLIPFRNGFSPPLARHKSLNYLYFIAARQHALDQGGDEALILDPEGKVTETAAGSLLVRSNGGWWTPHSLYQLPSITLNRLVKLFAEEGRIVERRSGTLKDLESADTVWVVSSLMLIMPASSVAGRLVPIPATEEAARWRQSLLGSP